MAAKLGARLHRFSRRWVPDPFVLALLVTVFVLALSLVKLGLEGGQLSVLPAAWARGVANPGGLAFALQMCLVLITGHAIATSPPVQRVIYRLARAPGGAASATFLVAFVACSAALIHWGLGAIAGALLAREIGRHAKEAKLVIHYPLMGAAAYVGMALWHGGMSGSAPLKVAEGDGAPFTAGLALGDMLLSPLNLAVCTSLVLVLPLLCLRLLPPAEERQPMEQGALGTSDEPGDSRGSEMGESLPIDWLQLSMWPGRFIGATGILVVSVLLAGDDFAFDINTVNALFFFLGLVLQGSLLGYMSAATGGAKGAGAIVIQFPLYFGILGLMKAAGLVAWLSKLLVDLSTETTFPVLSFWSAGLVNFFIPSGGGQWAVQRDILLRAGDAHGIDPVTTVMAFSYGDAWTNLLQPFWALPLLAIMGLRARDIIGYTALLCLAMGGIVPLWLLVLG